MLPIVIKFLFVIHILVSLLIVLLVLMQRPKNEGLGAAFGGGMTENLFGAQTTNVLQTITRWCGVIFFTLSLTLSWLYVKNAEMKSKSSIQQRLSTAPAVPAATPAPNEADLQKLQDTIKKAVEEKAAEVKPVDGTPVLPEAATPPVKPADPAAAPMPDAKATPAAEKPVKPEKAPAPAKK